MSFAGAIPIQSITIPTTSTRTQPAPPHTLYHIAVATPTSSYTVPTRYSAFVRLKQALDDQVGDTPPNEHVFPSKSYSILPSWATGGARVGGLSKEEIEDRRVKLELWLKGLIASKDRRWTDSRALREFLAVPSQLSLASDPDSDPSTSSATITGTKSSSADIPPPPTHWTPSTWSTEHSSLSNFAQSTLTLLSTRVTIQSSQVYQINRDAQSNLVTLLTRLQALDRALEIDLAKGGMMQGELERRREMGRRLRESVDEIGRELERDPRRGKLLAAGIVGGSGRALGAAASQQPARETAETRSLDNTGLLQLQDSYMATQDSKLEDLSAALRRQRELGLLIGDELRMQEETMDQVESGVDRVKKNLGKAGKEMRRLGG
ncbi:hypothetical protein T439DRAFT_322220 [Meredithblackwellia eburnea MCA 4105]